MMRWNDSNRKTAEESVSGRGRGKEKDVEEWGGSKYVTYICMVKGKGNWGYKNILEGMKLSKVLCTHIWNDQIETLHITIVC
jgi:hypothetical protein